MAQPFVPAPNVLQARMRYVQFGQLTENTLYFEGSAAVDTALATTLGNALLNWWSVNFQPQCSNQMALLQVYITDLTTQTGFTVAVTPPSALTGGSTTEALPNNVAFCVSFRTAARGRSSRGRNYVGGLTEADTNASNLLQSRATAIVNAYKLLMGAGVFVPGLQLVVVSRFTLGNPRPVALSRPVINILNVDLTVDSQRRRLPHRGT